jgi:hypothetical protein
MHDARTFRSLTISSIAPGVVRNEPSPRMPHNLRSRLWLLIILFQSAETMNKSGFLTRLLLLVALLGCETKLCRCFATGSTMPNRSSSSAIPSRQSPLFGSSLPPDIPIAVDPSLEAELLTGMAHIAMDFSGILFSPSRSILRLFTVFGRIFAISADYVIDHSIHTEELMIQLFLICVALKEYLNDPPNANNTAK